MESSTSRLRQAGDRHWPACCRNSGPKPRIFHSGPPCSFSLCRRKNDRNGVLDGTERCRTNYGPATARSFNGPPEAGRGFALFFDPTRDHCGVCHSMGGRGVAIAPDLAETVSKSQADAIALIRSTGARKVVRVKLNDGESFAAL